MARDIGLVLAGGGGRGAYQIGAWRALREFELDKRIGAVAGTSVGALNGALYVQGDYTLAENLWLSIEPEQVLTLDNNRYLNALKEFNLRQLARTGVFSHQGLMAIIQKYADLDKISNAEVPFFATCCRFPDFKVEYFRLNGSSRERVVSIMLATSAIPTVFDMIKIDGQTYIDGGVLDNTPVQPLYDAGFRQIIIINLNAFMPVKPENFPDAELIEIMPEKDMAKFFTGILDFRPAVIKERMQQGYLDTIGMLQPRFERPKPSLGQRLRLMFRRMVGNG